MITSKLFALDNRTANVSLMRVQAQYPGGDNKLAIRFCVESKNSSDAELGFSEGFMAYRDEDDTLKVFARFGEAEARFMMEGLDAVEGGVEDGTAEAQAKLLNDWIESLNGGNVVDA